MSYFRSGKYCLAQKGVKKPVLIQTYFDVTMNKVHRVTTFDGIGQLNKHPNQLIVAELGPVLILNQLGQVSILTVPSEQMKLVVNLPVVVQPKCVLNFGSGLFDLLENML